ncbi:MAG: phosphoribosylformylglycinamidine synthase I [Litorilinea sp.]
MSPKILILHASGTNRDQEAARACELAGGAPEIVHINRLRQNPAQLAEYGLLLLPGGFSFGDALGAGARLALDMQVFFQDTLAKFIDQDRLVLGICNGFQALVKADLLPGPELHGAGEDGKGATGALAQRRVTLTENERGHFECRWVHLAVNTQSPATYLAEIDHLIACPVAHGEGNFQVADAQALAELEQRNLVTFRYVDGAGSPAQGQYPLNPNGSVADIAGICNPRGNVLGLMPHPEDHVTKIQNPWPATINPAHSGLALFEAVVGAMVAVA